MKCLVIAECYGWHGTDLCRAISSVKDAVTYFGVGSLVGKYEGFNPRK